MGDELQRPAPAAAHLRRHLEDQLPDWRRDWKKIAYESGRDIWVMNADGSGQVNVTNTPDVQESGVWSCTVADGRRIAYLNFGERIVYTMKADGTDVQRVGPGLGIEFVPAWEPKPRSDHR